MEELSKFQQFCMVYGLVAVYASGFMILLAISIAINNYLDSKGYKIL